MSESGDAFGLLGTTLSDHLQIQSVVGAGGFGTVYRAYHTKLSCPVAVKCLRIPDFLDGPGRERFVQKFMGEGHLMYELSRADAGIVRTVEIDVFAMPTGIQVPYLVLEWVDGEPLEAVIEANQREGRRVSIEEVIEKLDPVARAIGAAHDGNVAHRDIKPSNIMITQVMGRQTAKILDFGIAKVVQETGGSAHTTRDAGESSFGFTPCYAAPEQWVARYGATGPWTDVFSFALVCIEYVTGQMALPGDTMVHWMGACMDPGQRPTPRARGADLGDAVEAVFLKALAVNPQERYRHVQAFWTELKAAVGVRNSRQSIPEGAAVSGHAATAYAKPSSGSVGAASGGMGGPGAITGPGGQGTVPGAYVPPPVPPPQPQQQQQYGALPPMGAPPPMGGPPQQGYGPAWGPHPGGGPSAGGMAMQPMGPGGYPMQHPQQPEKGGSSGVILGAVLAFVVCVFGVMLVLVIRMATDSEGPLAAATGTLPSLGAPTRPRSADEVIGALDPTKPADAPGSLSVYCVPACDAVLVDGKPVSASPMVNAPLKPGRHVVSVTRMGAAPQQVDVFVPAGRNVAQRFFMDP